MKKLRKLPVLLALVATLFAAACSEIDVTPRTEGEPDEDPIILPPSKSSTTQSDTLAIG